MNKLKERRKIMNYSQERLAERLGITQGAISQWEQGKSKPNIDKLIEISKIFQCSVDELID